jgi:hypothetical protein
LRETISKLRTGIGFLLATAAWAVRRYLATAGHGQCPNARKISVAQIANVAIHNKTFQRFSTMIAGSARIAAPWGDAISGRIPLVNVADIDLSVTVGAF